MPSRAPLRLGRGHRGRHLRGADLHDAWDAHGPRETPRRERLPEACADAVAGVCEHAAERHPCSQEAVQLCERDLRLRAIHQPIRRYPGGLEPSRIVRQLARQEEPEGDTHRDFAGERERDQRLAVRRLPCGPGRLARHTQGALPLLEQRGVVDDEHRVGPADQRLGLLGKHARERLRRPARGAHEVMQLREIVRRDARSQRLDALPVPRPEQPARYTGAQRRRRASPSAAQNGASRRSNTRSHWARLVAPTVAPSQLLQHDAPPHKQVGRAS